MRTPFLPYVTSSLTASAWGILQVTLHLLSGTCFSHTFPNPSLGNFSVADPNPAALILAFQPTMDFSAFFSCPFWCAIPGPLPLLRRAWHCFRDDCHITGQTASASHITGHNPTSQSLHRLLSHFKECQSKIGESLRVEKEFSFGDHSTSQWSPPLEKGIVEKVTSRDYKSVQNSHRVDDTLRELGFSPASQLNWNQPEIRCYWE